MTTICKIARPSDPDGSIRIRIQRNDCQSVIHGILIVNENSSTVFAFARRSEAPPKNTAEKTRRYLELQHYREIEDPVHMLVLVNEMHLRNVNSLLNVLDGRHLSLKRTT